MSECKQLFNVLVIFSQTWNVTGERVSFWEMLWIIRGLWRKTLDVELLNGIPVAGETCDATSLHSPRACNSACRLPATLRFRQPPANMLHCWNQAVWSEQKDRINSNGRFFWVASSVLSTSMIGFGLVRIWGPVRRMRMVNDSYMLQELLASFLSNKKGRSIGQHAQALPWSWSGRQSNVSARLDLCSKRVIHNFPGGKQASVQFRRTSMIQDTRLSWPVSALTTATLTLRSRSGNNLALTTMGSSSWYLGMIVAFWTWRSLAYAGETPRPFHCLGCKLIKFSNANRQFEEVKCRLNVWRNTMPRCVLQEAKERETTNSISIGDCFLTSLQPRTFVGLARILMLQIAGNPLFKIGHPDVFAGLENLRWLHLHRNLLREIHPAAFSGLKNLQQLSLHENMLPVLQKSWLASLPSLRYLHFRLNRVSTLEKDLFSHNPQMRKIDLTWNKLSTLPIFVFANLPNLTMLQLGANRIVTLPTFAFGGLEKNRELTIILKGNPIVCNKEMCSWLMEVRRHLKDSSCVFLLRNRTISKKINLADDNICDPEMQLSGFAGGGTKMMRREPLLPAPGH